MKIPHLKIAIRYKTHLVFSFESSSDSLVTVSNDVISPKDSFTFPKKSFTLSATVFSLSGVGSCKLDARIHQYIARNVSKNILPQYYEKEPHN